jgi:sulfide:quinone oxidoreductase
MMAKLHAVHHRASILIAGGGVAGLEALMALRSLLGTTAKIELLAPETEFSYRPIAVTEPFGFGEVRRVELARIASEHHAGYRNGALASVDPSTSTAHTAAGEALAYDFLIVAVGARSLPPIEGAVRFGGSEDSAALRRVLADAQSAAVKRIVFAAPPAIGWLLPLYELAMFTGSWAQQRRIPLELSLITAESRPLEAFGVAASDAVAGILAQAGIALVLGATARRFDGKRVTGTGIGLLPADAVVSLPQLEGPAIPGVPHDEQGFIPIDRHGAVQGVTSVYAAGDGTAFPIKQGGLAAQQADAAAEAIAAALGVLERPAPFRPVLRGLLLTGAEPRYLRASLGQGSAGSEVSFRPLWWPPAKIAGRHLAPYLASPGDPVLARAPFADREALAGDSLEQAANDERDAIELLLELADANAGRGSFGFALRCLDAAEGIAGALPARRQADRRAWTQRRQESGSE